MSQAPLEIIIFGSPGGTNIIWILSILRVSAQKKIIDCRNRQPLFKNSDILKIRIDCRAHDMKMKLTSFIHKNQFHKQREVKKLMKKGGHLFSFHVFLHSYGPLSLMLGICWVRQFELSYDNDFIKISQAHRGFQHRKQKFRNFTTLFCNFRDLTAQRFYMRVKTSFQFRTHFASCFTNCVV